jgi:hypothetical protein
MGTIVTGKIAGQPMRIRNADGSIGTARLFDTYDDAVAAIDREMRKRTWLMFPVSMTATVPDGRQFTVTKDS